MGRTCITKCLVVIWFQTGWFQVVVANRSKLYRNCAFSQSLHNGKLGKITVFYVVRAIGINGKILNIIDNIYNKATCRSNRSQMFFKISVLRNFAIFTGKHLYWSLFLIKLQASKQRYLKKNPTQVLFFEYWEILKNTFFLQNTSGGCFWICPVVIDGY